MKDRFNGRTLTIVKAEGSYVKHRLFLKGFTVAKVGEFLAVGANTVSNVLNGRRRSKKIETGIARLLGHECWDDVVAEARLSCGGGFQPDKRYIQLMKAFEGVKSDAQKIKKQ